VLRVEGYSVGYGDTQVLWDVSLEVGDGEFVALIGVNGAGKTTLINAISGIVPPLEGRILLDGTDITRTPSWDRVVKGVAQVPEGRKLFNGLTVEENLRLGAYLKRERRSIAERVTRILDVFPEIARRRRALAGNLSGGEQQMVAIGRALMSEPRLLMIDELSLGLAPVVVDRLAELLTRLHRELRLSVILVEQDVQLALELSSRGYVIETGRIILSGPCGDLLKQDVVRQAYLGLGKAAVEPPHLTEDR